MVCKNCGSELTEHEKFCPQCGQAVTPVENPIPEADSPIETPEEKVPSGDTTKTEGDKKAQPVQWDAVKKNLQQGAEIAAPILKAGFGKAKENLQQGAEKAAPILKAGFGKAKEFTAQTVHEFKDAAADVKEAGVSGASVAVAAKKINWKRLIPVAVALVVLIFIFKSCGGGGSFIKRGNYNGTKYNYINLTLEDFTERYNKFYSQACKAAGISADEILMSDWDEMSADSSASWNSATYMCIQKGLLGTTMLYLVVSVDENGHITMVSAVFNPEQVMGSGDFSAAVIRGLLYATDNAMNRQTENQIYSDMDFVVNGEVNINGLMLQDASTRTNGLLYSGVYNTGGYMFIIMPLQ